MSKVVVSPLTQMRKLSSFRRDLEQFCPHDIKDLTFVQQSHNATVFRGVLDGNTAFFKAYAPPDALKIVGRSIEEIDAVSARMSGQIGGVAPLLWASKENGIIATGEVPGVAVSDLLDKSDHVRMLQSVEKWLHAYAGDTSFADRFSTGYWSKKRQAVDLSGLHRRDRQLATDLRDMQTARAKNRGPVPAIKGQVPRDFAPWNLHWTGDAVWGFDMEGHHVAALVQSIARFRVLVVEQSSHAPLFESHRDTTRFGTPELMSFAYGDLLFDRFLKWVDHGVKGPRLMRAIKAHLDEG